MQRQKPHTYFFLLIIVSLVLSACSSTVTEQAIPEPEQNADMIASLEALDQLENILPLLEVNSIMRLSEFGCDKQPISSEHIWNGDEQVAFDICQPTINNGQALMFDFMFKEALFSEENNFEFLFGDYANGIENTPVLELRFPIGLNLLSTFMDGESFEQYDFDREMAWQAEQEYTALVNMAQNGCLDVMVWRNGEAPSMVRAGTCQQEWHMDFPNQDYQTILHFALNLPAGQAVKVNNMWLLDTAYFDFPSTWTLSDESTTETENETTSEPANNVDDESGESVTAGEDEKIEISDVLINTLHDFFITNPKIVKDLGCEVGSYDSEGNFNLDVGMGDYCRQSIKPGEILTFNFTYQNDMDRDNNRFIWMLKPLYDDQVDVYDEELGIDLANLDIVEKKKDEFINSNFFDNEWTWEAGREYSTAIVFMYDGSVSCLLWRPDDPGMVLTSNVNSVEWMGQFSGELESTTLQLGFWMNGGQSLTISDVILMEAQ